MADSAKKISKKRTNIQPNHIEDPFDPKDQDEIKHNNENPLDPKKQKEVIPIRRKDPDAIPRKETPPGSTQ